MHDSSTFKTKEPWLLVGFATVVAALLRFPELGSLPPGLWCDEAVTGYDALALFQTGMDMHGASWPLFAEGLGDYNESLYRFLAAPFVGLFGLSEWSTRLPAALFGTATIPLVYVAFRNPLGPRIAAFAALFLAISPWHLLLSRVAFRAILLPFFFLLAIGLLESSKKEARFLIAGGLALGLALWTYSAARIFVPLMVPALLYLYVWPQRKKTLLVGLSVALPVLWLALLASFWFSDEGLARASETLGVSHDISTYLAQYVSYFSPDFLFGSGDPNERHSLLEWGQLHTVEALLVTTGLVHLITSQGRRVWWLWAWLLLYPIPGALTEESHAMRTILGAPAFAILSGAGLDWLLSKSESVVRPKVASLLVPVLGVALGMHVGAALYADYPAQSATAWDYGYREAFEVIEKIDPPCVVLSDRLFLPHVFALFYGDIPPHEAQKTGVPSIEQGNWFATDVHLGRYHVQSLAQTKLSQGACLFLLRPSEVPTLQKQHEVRPIHLVKAPGGEPVLGIVEGRATSPTP